MHIVNGKEFVLTLDTDVTADASPVGEEDRLAALEQRLKDTISGTVGSLKPRLERLESLASVVDEIRQDMERRKLAAMSPEQAKLALLQKSDKRPTASEFFGTRAERLIAQAGLTKADIDWPDHDFKPGKPAQSYADSYDSLVSAVVDARMKKAQADVGKDVSRQVREKLQEAGLTVTDTGSGAAPSGRRKFTREQIAQMSPAEYAQHRDLIMDALGLAKGL